MNTFLPYESYRQSAAALDYQRLGKQRADTLEIMSALVYKTGFVNAPATNMWRGYEFSLLYYQVAICEEWHLVRGFADTYLRQTMEIFWDAPFLMGDDEVAVPPFWLGDPEFHKSHQSALLREDQDHYSKIFRGIPNDLELVWPV